MLAATASMLSMKTLYLRNVPDEVAERLAHLARRERMSLNAYAVRELTAIAERAHFGNADILRELPNHPRVPVEDLLAGIHEGRR